MNVSKRLFSKVFLNYCAFAFSALFSLAMAPIIVRHLGAQNYGILTLALLIAGTTAFLDLIFGAATIRGLAVSLERSQEESTQVFWTGLLVQGSCGLLLLVLFYFLAPQSVLSSIGSGLPNLSPVALLFILNMLFGFTAIPLLATQRTDRYALLISSVACLTFGGHAVLASFGAGVPGLLLWSGCSVLAGTLLGLYFARNFFRSKPAVSVCSLKNLLHFSGYKGISSVSGYLLFQADRFLLAFFLPVVSLTFYTIPLSLAQKVLSLIPPLTLAIYPVLARQNRDFEGIYLKTSRYVLMGVAHLSIFLLFFRRTVLLLWMGPEIADQSSRVLQMLALAFMVASLSAVPTVALEARGRPDIPAFFSILSLCLTIGFAVFLVPLLGMFGLPLSLFLNAVLQVPFFIRRANAVFGISPARWWSEVVKRSAGGIVLVILVYLVPLRIENWWLLLLEFGVGSVVFLCASIFAGAIDPVEIRAAWNSLWKIPSKSTV